MNKNEKFVITINPWNISIAQASKLHSGPHCVKK